MAPPQFKVIIAGGGTVGLALGVILERAGIDYLILETSAEIRPLGAIIYLGPPVLRAFEQLGLLDDLIRQSNILTGVTLMDHKLNQIYRLNLGYSRDRYGYDTLTIARPKLYDILLSRIPAYKILFGKHVVSTVQNGEGVKVRCADGSTYSGSILVAADGGASAIRKAMYDEIQRRSKKVPHPTDYEQSKMDQRCIVGICEPMSTRQFPVLASKNCEMILVMPKEINCMVWFVPMAENRFGWGVTSPLPSTADPSPPHSRGKSGESTESSFDTPSSPSSIHGMSRSFSAMSTTTYSPASSVSSSPIQPPYGDGGDYLSASHGYNNSSSTSSPFSNSNGNQHPSNAVKKRQSLGRLSKHSASSGGSQKGFQKFPTVLQSNESTTLDLKELPNDRLWGRLDEKYTIEEAIREQESPFGGTLGDIIDATSRKMITMVVVEEKFYHTWHFGRTVLLGDACHKLLPSSGHGTTQAILDAISLASLLAELPTNSTTDIDAIFRLQYERRGPPAKAAVFASQQQDQLLFNRRLSGKVIRKMTSTWISEWLHVKMGDRIFESRPMLPFLKPVPDRGSAKNKDKSVPLLKDKRYEIARRKSISSGYLTGGTGSSGLRGDDQDPWGVTMEFETTPFSTSMPSIVMPPAVPSLPLGRSLLLTPNKDDALKSMGSR